MSTEISPTAFPELLQRLDRMLDLFERTMNSTASDADEVVFASAIAFSWQRREGGGHFRPIKHPDVMQLEYLLGIDRQREALVRNTRQFLCGVPANHVLLWGERGTGKSSVIKALLQRFAGDGLRLVQVHRHDLLDLPEMIDRLWDRPEYFILFCDDLSFEEDDAEYKELKALLEGGLTARARNVLVYATSNRRHLMPEHMADRQLVFEGDEVHPNEAIEEKLSLADRFGIRLGFYAVDQRTYLEIVHHLAEIRCLQVDLAVLDREALRWSLSYSGRSGRSARQFIDDLEGRLAMDNMQN